MRKSNGLVTRFSFSLLLLLVLLWLNPAPSNGGGTPTLEPSGTRMPDPASWTKPPPPGTTQADRGAMAYWMNCMTCHGDKGQGLAAFRQLLPAEDQNCTNHRCHGGPQSPAGFSFPDAPAIVGPNALAPFETAADLYAFISKRMPYQQPGMLSSEEYLAITAFLMRENGVLPKGVRVDDQNAGNLTLKPAAATEISPFAVGMVILALIVLGLWLGRVHVQRK